MLTNLQTLHELIKTLGEKLEAVRKERDAALARDTVPRSDYRSLQVQKAEIEQQFQTQQAELTALNQQAQTSSSKVNELQAKLEALQAQNQELLGQKNELEAKNRISLERAKSILERLSAIDQGQLS